MLRNLYRAGVPVVSLDSNRQNVTFRSRYVSSAVCPDWDRDEEALVAFLIKIGRGQSHPPVLLCSNDSALSVVLRHRDQLASYYRLPPADWKTAEVLVNKEHFYRKLQALGLPHPRTYYPKSLLDIQVLSQRLRDYPYIVKPIRSKYFEQKFGVKCWCVDTSQQLVASYLRAADIGERVLVQKEVAGQERYLVYTFFDRRGHFRASCCYRKLRLNPPDYGNACLCESIALPEAVALTQATLQAFGYRGLAEAEIQRDPNDGKLKLIEINARTTTQTRLSSRCGVNMEMLLYCDMVGLPLPKPRPPVTGIKWLHITRDVYAVFHKEGYLARGKLGLREYWQSLRGQREYAMFAWDDPLPFFYWVRTYFRNFSLNRGTLERLLRHLNHKRPGTRGLPPHVMDAPSDARMETECSVDF